MRAVPTAVLATAVLGAIVSATAAISVVPGAAADARAGSAAGATTSATRFEGRRCTPPSGHRIADCRLGRHGTPDLSRAAWRALRGAEVTISVQVHSVAPNPAAGGARSWPLIDSLAQPIGQLTYLGGRRFEVTGTDRTSYRVTSVRMRGRGCAASPRQSRDFPLVQVIARAPSGGTQAFVDGAALNRASASGRAALRAFRDQRGGGTGCGPSGREVGKLRPLANPNVGAHAHARLSNGEINTVTEYDAKPAFGNVLYFMSNTTNVSVGGIARGMVRVGTPVAKVDSLARCDPNSDGTLTWRYWSIRTGRADRPRLYGWIPTRCPAQMRG
ncbi:MAG: hypothetical protein Q8O56_01570 [Solirubrobacteraceae bacterium]|nr:hypothetical protein [Solirubrobacteraceae bacterium]